MNDEGNPGEKVGQKKGSGFGFSSKFHPTEILSSSFPPDDSMARLLHSLRRVLGLASGSTTSTTARTRSIDTDFSIFRGAFPRSFAICVRHETDENAEGDRVVLHTKQPQLSTPLIRGGKTALRRGHLEHDRIIGSRVWDVVQAHRGQCDSILYERL